MKNVKRSFALQLAAVLPLTRSLPSFAQEEPAEIPVEIAD